MTNAELIEIMKNDDPNAQMDFKILYGNGELKPVIHGKWERGYSFPDGEYVKCTVCGEIIKCIYPMHYCPTCGADMRE